MTDNDDKPNCDDQTKYDSKVAMEPEPQVDNAVLSKELAALCRRFEIAVANFGNSCAALRANEKAFQAWYAASVIQEFGISRVYREIHLLTEHLFDGSEGLDAPLSKGSELFPDLSISWKPGIDARHTVFRDEGVHHATHLLDKIAIVTELKVTGSTGKHTPPKKIETDLNKLMVFHRAYLRSPSNTGRGLGAYMVILDNAPGNGTDGFKHHYSTKELGGLLKRVGEQWDDSVPKPTTLLIEPVKFGARTHVFRSLGGEPESL